MATVVSIDGRSVEPPAFQIDADAMASLAEEARQAFTAIADLKDAEATTAAALRRLAGMAPESGDYSSWGPWADYVRAIVDEASTLAFDLEDSCSTCLRSSTLSAGAAMLELALTPLYGLDEYGRPRRPVGKSLSKRARELIEFSREDRADAAGHDDGC